MSYPGYLAAIDHKRSRIFVLSTPNLSAIKIDGEWQYSQPLPDEEIRHYTLITDLDVAKKYVAEAKKELRLDF